jgi:hypothetical protein
MQTYTTSDVMQTFETYDLPLLLLMEKMIVVMI